MRTAIAVLVLSAPLLADVAYREDCTYESLVPQDPFKRTTYFAKDKVRVEETEGRTVTIYRLDRGVLWIFAAKMPTYFEAPLKAASAAAAAEISSQKKNLEAAKAKLLKEIEELKEKLKKEKNAKAKPPLEAEILKREDRIGNIDVALTVGKPVAWAEPTDEKAQILGHPTVKWKVYVNGFMSQEAWVSDEFKGVEEYRKQVDAMYKKYDVVNDESAMQGALLKETKGMPLKRRVLAERGGEPGEDGKSPMDVWLVSEMTELQFTPVAPSLFELPPGARKR